jgi:hypothetical protein
VILEKNKGMMMSVFFTNCKNPLSGNGRGRVQILQDDRKSSRGDRKFAKRILSNGYFSRVSKEAEFIVWLNKTQKQYGKACARSERTSHLNVALSSLPPFAFHFQISFSYRKM